MGEPLLPGLGADLAAELEINHHAARLFEELAGLLEEQGANPFRIGAYLRAAETLRRLYRPASEILEREGVEGLEALPTIGEQLARQLRLVIETGRLPMLERLRGESDPVTLLASVPGIGPILAERVHHELDVHTLEDLELAAHGGRLRQVPGFGEKRVAGVVESLATRLSRTRRRPPEPSYLPAEPSLAELLELDRAYREKAAADELRKIAPRRFNPRGRAWLPILHATRGDRHYTALFSNTAQAHRLGRTGDWVVVYWDGERGDDGQCTVVTSRQPGPLHGLRVVRGREAECLEHYRRAG
jgi:putative hydrolase